MLKCVRGGEWAPRGPPVNLKKGPQIEAESKLKKKKEEKEEGKKRKRKERKKK